MLKALVLLNKYITLPLIQLSGFTFGEQFDFTHQSKVKINNLTYQHLLISSFRIKVVCVCAASGSEMCNQ